MLSSGQGSRAAQKEAEFRLELAEEGAGLGVFGHDLFHLFAKTGPFSSEPGFVLFRCG
jgi:hypothetical protein